MSCDNRAAKKKDSKRRGSNCIFSNANHYAQRVKIIEHKILTEKLFIKYFKFHFRLKKKYIEKEREIIKFSRERKV